MSSFLLQSVSGQATSPCSLPEAQQFDFWLGDWNLSWNDSVHGTNHVEKILGNCTVQENFYDPSTNMYGKSWSVYNPNLKLWQQTWVDSQGGYIVLNGGMKGDSMILATGERTVPKTMSPNGKMISRMVYYAIKLNSFDWDWESSTDGGKNWTSKWLIHYSRNK